MNTLCFKNDNADVIYNYNFNVYRFLEIELKVVL